MRHRLRYLVLILIAGVSLFLLQSESKLRDVIQMPYNLTVSEVLISTSTVRLTELTTTSSNKQTFPITTQSPTTIIAAYNRFQNVLSRYGNVQQWSANEFDAKLHHLSHWSHLNAQQWLDFVNKSIAKLDPPMSTTKIFTFFELGVGAFSRRLLLQYPYANGIGVDIVRGAIDIARIVLSSNRMKLYTVSNNEYNMIDNSTIDHIIVPGVICYFPSVASIENLIRELVRIAKPGASMCFTMIPFDASGKFSCNLIISPSFWSKKRIRSLGVRVTSRQNMSEWNLPYSQYRYAVNLRKNVIT
ncbi:unnamed protein product [Adineta steineri]|uniref:Methyltransferase type 11 domain-containing protein n=1 Tax=Adineta steineri TaxID=433720 RepID=A0A813T856_9BILA|nr:unnamed protein product [Adineta steineri]CAF3550031.1 unnamed protein product [Adineta steineri]CAF4010087.1 unnamed protein product [Adineta steineri]